MNIKLTTKTAKFRSLKNLYVYGNVTISQCIKVFFSTSADQIIATLSSVPGCVHITPRNIQGLAMYL